MEETCKNPRGSARRHVSCGRTENYGLMCFFFCFFFISTNLYAILLRVKWVSNLWLSEYYNRIK